MLSDNPESILYNLSNVMEAFDMPQINDLASYEKQFHQPVKDVTMATDILSKIESGQVILSSQSNSSSVKSNTNVKVSSNNHDSDNAQVLDNQETTINQSSTNHPSTSKSKAVDSIDANLQRNMAIGSDNGSAQDNNSIADSSKKREPVINQRQVKYAQLVDKSYAKETPSADIYDSSLSKLMEFDTKNKTYRRVTPMPKGAKRIDVPNAFWDYLQANIIDKYGDLGVSLFSLPSSTVLMFLLTESMSLDVQQAFADAFSPQTKNTLRQFQEAREVKQNEQTTDEKVDDILNMLTKQAQDYQNINRKVSDVNAQLTSRQLSLIYALSWNLESNNYTDEQLGQIFSSDRISAISRFLVQFGDKKLEWLNNIQNDQRKGR